MFMIDLVDLVNSTLTQADVKNPAPYYKVEQHHPYGKERTTYSPNNEKTVVA